MQRVRFICYVFYLSYLLLIFQIKTASSATFIISPAFTGNTHQGISGGDIPGCIKDYYNFDRESITFTIKDYDKIQLQLNVPAGKRIFVNSKCWIQIGPFYYMSNTETSGYHFPPTEVEFLGLVGDGSKFGPSLCMCNIEFGNEIGFKYLPQNSDDKLSGNPWSFTGIVVTMDVSGYPGFETKTYSVIGASYNCIILYKPSLIDDGTFSYLGDDTLPVTLSSFTATEKNGSVLLTWMTESEVDNLGYILERCETDKSNWQEIASYKTFENLRSNGNTSSRQSYKFMDTEVKMNTDYSYRLSEVDINGITEVKKILNIKTKVEQKFDAELYPAYPNPFNPITKIFYSIREESTVNLKVVDLMGRTMKYLLNNARQPIGRYNLEWNGKNEYGQTAPSGAYLLIFKAGDFYKIQKILFIH